MTCGCGRRNRAATLRYNTTGIASFTVSHDHHQHRVLLYLFILFPTTTRAASNPEPHCHFHAWSVSYGTTLGRAWQIFSASDRPPVVGEMGHTVSSCLVRPVSLPSFARKPGQMDMSSTLT
jgi:hypothetical protein